ncbi:MAG: hypothetical protein H0V23_13940 [Nocardioidaceae bacterium]|nr:hypothetical protein [Nocardioidaceae bacterium]
MHRMIAALAGGMLSLAGLAACGDGNGSGGGSTEEFCALDETIEFESIDNLDDFDSALDVGVDAAPDEIKDDIEIVRDTMNQLTDQLREDGVEDLTDITEEQARTLQDLSTAEFEDASENIQQFIEDNCDTGS